MFPWEQALNKSPMKSRRVGNLIFTIFTTLKCYVLNNRYHIGNFDPKSDERVFIAYLENSRAHKAYNMSTQTIIVSINIKLILLMITPLTHMNLRLET